MNICVKYRLLAVSQPDKSSSVRPLQFRKVAASIVTFEVSQLLTFTSVSAAQSMNNPCMSVRPDVFHLRKSILVTPVSPNIRPASVKLEVSQSLTASSVRPGQCKNSECMFWTLDVSHLLTSSFVRPLQP